jgi:hypothetical protein
MAKKAATTKSYLVFISHSAEDRWIAKQMANLIEAKGRRHGVKALARKRSPKMNLTKQGKNKRPIRVFFSYATADNVYARKLHRILSHHLNLRIFTHEALSAGEDWKSKLKKELAQCDIFVVLLSPNSVDSAWVLQELGAVWMVGKPIFPIVTHQHLLAKIPVELRNAQIVNIKDLENPETINQIIESFEEQIADGRFVS